MQAGNDESGGMRNIGEQVCAHLIGEEVDRVSAMAEEILEFTRGRVIALNATETTVAELVAKLQGLTAPEFKEKQLRFLTDLRDHGCECTESVDAFRIRLTDGAGPELIFETARACGVQVRYLRPAAETLEDVFLRALGHSVP